MRALCMTLCLAVSGVSAKAAGPVFMFHEYRDAAVFPVLAKYFGPADYIGIEAVERSPTLGTIATREHQFEMTGKSNVALTSVGCGPDTAGTVVYHGPAATAEVVAAIEAGGCQQVGIAPPGEMIGVTGQCSYVFQSGPLDGLNWNAINFFDIQAEGIISDECGGAAALPNYLKFVAAAAAYARSKNPKIVIAAQLSFRMTPPQAMIQAIQQMASAVDRVLFSYPLSSDSKYSKASNLETVMQAFRTAKATPAP